MKSGVAAATRTDGRSFFPALKGWAKIIGRGRIGGKKHAALDVSPAGVKNFRRVDIRCVATGTAALPGKGSWIFINR